MISDEGGYAYVANRWWNDTGHLYHDVWVSRPQGILVIYGAVDALLGSSVVSYRFVAWLATVVTMLMVWRYARDWAGHGTAIIAALSFAAISAAPSLEGFTANAEVFMAVPSALAAWILLDEQRHGWRPRRLLWVGGLSGIATLLKPSGLVMLGVAIAFIVLEGKARGGVSARRIGIVGIGFAAAIAPALIHGWIVGWDAFVFASVAYRAASQNTLTNGPLHHLKHLAMLLLHSWWLWLAILVPFWGRLRAVQSRQITGMPASIWARTGHALRPRSIAAWIGKRGDDPGGTLLRLWLLGCLAGIAMGGDWWSHYLLQAAAPVAIGLAVLVRDWATAAPPVRQVAYGSTVTLLLLAPYTLLALSPPHTHSETIFDNSTYPIEEQVGAYVGENTLPSDRIYVAFNTAAIYYLSDRMSSYPYLFNQELLAFPNAEADLIAMVTGYARPEIVVRTTMSCPFEDDGAAFWQAVRENYRIETVIDGVVIYRAIYRAIAPEGLSPEV
jgi:4-amino-4-deoxy-L-arabinose transferase-like glycosyltransferase